MNSLSPIAITPRRGARAVLIASLVLLVAGGTSACSPDRLLGDKPLPPDVPDPTETHTPAGALATYRGAEAQLSVAFGGNDESYIPMSGLLTDELRSSQVGQTGGMSEPLLVDSRFLPEDAGTSAYTTTPITFSIVYGFLQRVRGQARQARGALHAYAPDSSPALTGHLDAIEGYADVLLADLFCSGVPLSTLDFDGDFTYQPGSSTEEVYEHAVALFDSALAISADSERIMNLARVGKGRSLLALGRYAEAAQAVADVPDGFQYAFDYSATTSPGAPAGSTNRNFVFDDFSRQRGFNPLTLVDVEGGSGLPFLSSGDPRSAWASNGTNRYGIPLSRPTMYAQDGSSSLILASGVEARLIQAEAQLQAGDVSGWLATLNRLRTDGTYDTEPDPADSTKTDTLWHAGTGGVAGLAPLSDPGTPDGQVSLLFQERAYWLFLTGHRQGDLRRLVREYGRDPESVYPTGPYQGAYATYGTDVTAPIPPNERAFNPLFTGCRSRGA